MDYDYYYGYDNLNDAFPNKLWLIIEKIKMKTKLRKYMTELSLSL